MWAIILSFGALQGVFLAVVLFIHKRGNKKANWILAVLILLLSLNIFRYLLVENDNLSIPFLSFVGLQAVPFLYGPLLYLYTEVLFKKSINLKGYLVHFVPSFLILISIIPFWIGNGFDGSDFIQSNKKNLRTAVYLVFGIQFLHMLFYNIIILNSIKNLCQALKQTRSNLKEIDNFWFKYLLRGYTIFLSLMFLYFILLISGLYYSYSEQVDFFIVLIISFFIHFISFKTLIHPEIISGNVLSGSSDKYKNSNLTIEKSMKFKNLLTNYMRSSKPYHNSELKLNDLAENLSIQPHHLSQVINEQHRMNFFDFINTHRIEEAKNILCNSESNETILSIAYTVGFNSKTAFNRAFKKHTQMTPSQFKKANR